MTSLVSSDVHDSDTNDLEGTLSKHHELKTEIDTMGKNFENLNEIGESLITGGHYDAEVIKSKLNELRGCWKMLLMSWDIRVIELQKRKKAEHLNREVGQLEVWLLTQQAELELSEEGNSLENVEDLLKKQDEIERMLLAQEQRFLSLIHLPENEGESSIEGNFHKSPDSAVDEKGCDSFSESSAVKQHVDLVEQSPLPSKFQIADHENGQIGQVLEITNQEVSKTHEVPHRSVSNLIAADFLPEETSLLTKTPASTSSDSEHEPLNSEDNATINDHRPKAPSEKKAFDTHMKEKELKVQSIFDLYNGRVPKESMNSGRIFGLSPVYAGFLQRKQEMDVVGEKSAAQPWRSYYTVLCEEELQFFKDSKGFQLKWPLSNPLSLVGAACDEAEGSLRFSHIFRVTFRDRSQYLFVSETNQDMNTWITKINSVIRTASDIDGSAAHDDDGECSKELGMSTPSSVLRDLRNASSGNRVSETPKIIITDPNSNVNFLTEEDTNIIEEKNMSGSRDVESHMSDDIPYLPMEDPSITPDLHSIYDHQNHCPPDSSGPLDDPCLPKIHSPSFTHIPDTPHSSDISYCSVNSPYPDEATLPFNVSPSSDIYQLTDILDISETSHLPDAPQTRDLTEDGEDRITQSSHDKSPCVPCTLPPSILVMDQDREVPPDLPLTLPPSLPEDADLPEMLDFIPPPVLDASFDFLMVSSKKDKVSHINLTVAKTNC